MYAYCGNNPVNREDDQGQLWGTIVANVLVGGVMGAIAGGLSAKANGESALFGVVIGGLTGAATGMVSMFASVATVGKAIASVVAYFLVGAGGNALNQYTNYRLQDKPKRENAQNGVVTTSGSTASGQSQDVADAAYNASCFDVYFDEASFYSAASSNVIWGVVGTLGGNFLSWFVGEDTARSAMWAVDVAFMQIAYDMEGTK